MSEATAEELLTHLIKKAWPRQPTAGTETIQDTKSKDTTELQDERKKLPHTEEKEEEKWEH